MEYSKSSIPSTFQVPLRAETKQKGRATLIIGLIAMAMVRFNVYPEKLEGFGIALPKENHLQILVILAAVIAYLLAGFLYYAIVDFVENRTRFYRDKIKEHNEVNQKPTEDSPIIVPSQVRFYQEKIAKWSIYKYLFVWGLIYDGLLPILLGILAIYDICTKF
jgi:hypothetical protein